MKSETPKSGITMAARRSLCASRGNGGVGDRALAKAQLSAHGERIDFNLLGKSLPGVHGIVEAVHDGAHLCPHRCFHGNLGLIV